MNTGEDDDPPATTSASPKTETKSWNSPKDFKVPPTMNTGADEPTAPASASPKRETKSWNNPKDFNNLPENFQLTDEIIRTNVCWVCKTYHESGAELLPLHEPYKGATLSRVINCLIRTKLQKNDGQAQVACRKCSDQIMAWYKMRRESIGITRILQLEAEKLRSRVANLNDSHIITYHVMDVLRSSDEEAPQ